LQNDATQGVILFDFKENLKCGSCPNETNTDYYEKFSITCFGVLVFHLKNIYVFDFLSKDLNHDGFFASHCLMQLFQNPVFKNLNISNLSIWSDGASHFKNLEIAAFYNSVYLNFKKFEWNFFIPYHGKNYCDSHFSVVSRIIKTYENNEGKIDSLEKLSLVLEEKFESIKNNYQFDYYRKKHKKKFQNAKIFVVPISIPERDNYKTQLNIKGIKQYFSFQFEGNKISARFLTSDKQKDEISKVIKSKLRSKESDSENSNSKKRKKEDVISIGSKRTKLDPSKISPTYSQNNSDLISFLDETLNQISRKENEPSRETHVYEDDPMEID